MVATNTEEFPAGTTLRADTHCWHGAEPESSLRSMSFWELGRLRGCCLNEKKVKEEEKEGGEREEEEGEGKE